jgi:hypothetical protein
MYAIIKEQIKQDYYIQNFPNEGQRFVAWYLRNIHHRDLNQTRHDITDGADDKQIDAIVIDDDKSTIYVIQGKFIGAPTVDAEPLREVLSAWIQLKNLVRLQETANIKLKRKLSEVSSALEDDYEVCFELITTSTLTKSAQNDLATYQKKFADLSDKDDFSATINIIDNEELKRRYELALDYEHPIINYSLTLDKGKYISMIIAGTNVVIAAIPLKECIDIPGIRDGT